jgi:hypothetical protein
MSALNDFYENRKFEFTEFELDEMENEFLKIVSNKFKNTSEVDLDCDEGSSDEVFWLTQMKINVGSYEIIVRGDDNGTPVLDVVHDSNILGAYYPKNITELVRYLEEIIIK